MYCIPPLQDGPELWAGPGDAGGAFGVDGVARQRVVGVRSQREPLHQLHREEEELLKDCTIYTAFLFHIPQRTSNLLVQISYYILG